MSYYILFDTYTDGMALNKAFREENIEARIAPTPHSIQGEYGCGVSLMVEDCNIDRAREFVEKSKAKHAGIAYLDVSINPRRDKYC